MGTERTTGMSAVTAMAAVMQKTLSFSSLELAQQLETPVARI
jgi:hypothetical protein